AIAILASWLIQAGDGPVFRIERDGYRQAIVRACARAFPHPTLTDLSRIDRKNLNAADRAELQAWDRKHQWFPNQLRHTFATQVRREHGLEAAQVLLGHSRADVTQVYAERDVKKAQDVARKIG